MSKIKIASFNVNSIKARLPSVLAWLKSSQPDVVLLQEIKCLEKDFPFEAFFDMGYNAAVCGQKSYNGVAILSKFKIEDVVKTLPYASDSKVSHNFKQKAGAPKSDGFFAEEQSLDQARYIEAVISAHGKAIRVASIYVPNGGGEIAPHETLESSEKFLYKLEFFDRLNAHLAQLLAYDEIAIFGGDYNVAAEKIDVYDPANLDGTVCFHPLERQKFRALLNIGLTDSYRAFNQQNQAFSWWDYRGGSWQYNKGMRIDYLLTSALATDKISNASIEDKNVRDQEKASDHCPVCVEIDI